MSRECPTAGGGGGGNACFKCGEEGHRKSDCPNSAQGGGGNACFKCGEEGHRKSDCPQGGGDACFRCGEEGHRKSDCPNAAQDGGGGGGGNACFKCGEEGHRKSDCPNAAQGGGGGDTCFKCGEEGHRKSDCPQGGGDACFRCGEEGHRKSDCPNPAKDGGSSACRKCGEEGHFARECPLATEDDNKCRYCKEEGHFAKECPNKPADDGKCRYCKEEGHQVKECPTKPADDGKCRRCGEEGHFAKECTNVKEGEPGVDGKPAPVTYIPDVVDDADSLFKRGCNAGINFDKYDSIEVEVSGPNVDKAALKISSFTEAGLYEQTFENVQKSGYKKPTPIQKYAIGIINNGRDLMACAQTGSGKTAAFLLPIITGILKSESISSSYNEKQEPAALILAPTRELVMQTHSEAKKFCTGTMVKCCVAYGGVATSFQMSKIEAGCDLLIATPGRLVDFVERGKLSLAKLKYLVLDEADRMLDMGFEAAIRKIVGLGMPDPGARQTLMFSATFPEEIQRLAGEFMKEYIFLTVGIVGGANSDVDQTILQVQQFDKREKLLEVLRSVPGERILVFVGQKRNADFLATYLSSSGFSTTSIHGDRLQREREKALRDFCTKECEVLIATNVAARGLDIPNVKLVVNYDLPTEIEEYVHRIGRSGRCGNTGRAVTFFDPNETADQGMARPLVRQLMNCQMTVPDWLEAVAAGAMSAGGGEARRDARGRKKVVRENAADDDEWGDGANAGSGGAGGAGLGAAPESDDEKWD